MDIISKVTTSSKDQPPSNVLANLAAAYTNDDDEEQEVSSLSDSVEGMEKFQELDTTTNRTLIRDPIIIDDLPSSSKSNTEELDDQKLTKSIEISDDKNEKECEIISSKCETNLEFSIPTETSITTTAAAAATVVDNEPNMDVTETENSGKNDDEINNEMEEDDSNLKKSSQLNQEQQQSVEEEEISNNIPTPCNSTVDSLADSEENAVQFQGDSYQVPRVNESSDGSSSDDEGDFSGNYDSDSESDDSEPRNEENINLNRKKAKGPKQPPKVKGELSATDLPPIEDLQISVPFEKCQAIGVVQSFVDPLVIVEGYPNSPVLNLDSVLFVDKGERALGHIFDVFGPVKHPHYCVRFNSKVHVDERVIKPGMIVYCAPATPHSKFVFLSQLEKLKGTDASWLDDVEPPAGAQEFSDDEQERAAHKLGGRGRRKRGKQFDTSVPPNLDEEQQQQQHRNAMPRKRNYNYVESDTQYSNGMYHPSYQHAHSYPQRSSPYVPSNVPGFGPPPPPFYPPSNLHHHFYERGGRRMQQFRPHYDNAFHHRGSWSSFQVEHQPRHYWRPPPIQGKPNWAPFAMNDLPPFYPRHHHPHNRPRLFPKSAIALASSQATRTDVKERKSPSTPPPPGCDP